MNFEFSSMNHSLVMIIWSSPPPNVMEIMIVVMDMTRPIILERKICIDLIRKKICFYLANRQNAVIGTKKNSWKWRKGHLTEKTHQMYLGVETIKTRENEERHRMEKNRQNVGAKNSWKRRCLYQKKIVKIDIGWKRIVKTQLVVLLRVKFKNLHSRPPKAFGILLEFLPNSQED